MTPATVDLDEVRRLITVGLSHLDKVDGAAVPDRAVGKSRSAEMATLSRELLFVSHVLDKARVAVLDEYYLAKGFEDHLLDEPAPSERASR